MSKLKKLLAILPVAKAVYDFLKKRKAKKQHTNLRADRPSDLYYTNSDLTRFK